MQSKFETKLRRSMVKPVMFRFGFIYLCEINSTLPCQYFERDETANLPPLVHGEFEENCITCKHRIVKVDYERKTTAESDVLVKDCLHLMRMGMIS